MRGKLQMCFVSGQKRRITPAHAGKTYIHKLTLSVDPDHPRTCGENVILMGRLTKDPGSPPHMRGKLELQPMIIQERRITPAHAGKTKVSTSEVRFFTDHPRTCGENSRLFPLPSGAVGSPPHMRGKPSGLASDLYRVPDHPRTCGENLRLL